MTEANGVNTAVAAVGAMGRHDMSDRADRAEDLFKTGYNCAQSLFASVHDELSIDRDLALRMASSFGGGMGRLREVCGALTGLFMVVGIRYGYIGSDDQEGKTRHYELIQELAGRFKDQFGSILCRDLLELDEQVSEPTPEVRTEAYYQRRPCVMYIRFAAGLLDELENRLSAEQPV